MCSSAKQPVSNAIEQTQVLLYSLGQAGDVLGASTYSVLGIRESKGEKSN